MTQFSLLYRIIWIFVTRAITLSRSMWDKITNDFVDDELQFVFIIRYSLFKSMMKNLWLQTSNNQQWKRIRCSFITLRLREIYLLVCEIVARKLLGIRGFNNYARGRGDRGAYAAPLKNNTTATSHTSASQKYFVTPQKKACHFFPRRESGAISNVSVQYATFNRARTVDCP